MILLHCRLSESADNFIVVSGISSSTSENPIYAVSIAYSQFPFSVKVI